jgi:hypothetical protein
VALRRAVIGGRAGDCGDVRGADTPAGGRHVYFEKSHNFTRDLPGIYPGNIIWIGEKNISLAPGSPIG